MNIRNIIKSAILDKELRDNLVKQPLQTCKDCGILNQIMSLGFGHIDFFSDSSIMQGGYRP